MVFSLLNTWLQSHFLFLLCPSTTRRKRKYSVRMVTKNKTKFRPNLKFDGMLASILTIKLANPESCHQFDPPIEVLKSSKHATVEYNSIVKTNLGSQLQVNCYHCDYTLIVFSLILTTVLFIFSLSLTFLDC